MKADFAEILKLEKQLQDKNYRHAADFLESTLADDFIEIGSSGKTYNKKDILTALPKQAEQTIELSNPEFKTLSHGLILLTYQASKSSTQEVSLRSSIWKKHAQTWQLIFHQGTTRKI